MAKQKHRLDDVMISRGMATDREDALRKILSRSVLLDDAYPTSGAVLVSPDSNVKLAKEKKYVSRGGYKLEGALVAFNQKVEGMNCIDIGSSTGGFTDCLLQHGAKSVVALDVNYGQLAWKLRQDPRVIVHERCNIKNVIPRNIGAPFDLLVADLSFIGLAQLASTFARLCRKGTILIVLVKPQFESSRGEAPGGVVISRDIQIESVHKVQQSLEDVGFTVCGFEQSPLKGKKKKNTEYLLRAIYEQE